MDIKGINSNATNHFNKLNPVEKKTSGKNNNVKHSTDKLDISQDAKRLSGENVNSSKINTVKKRVEIGFYNSEAIISKVAERILNELA